MNDGEPTVTIEPTREGIVSLGLLIVVRTFLSWSITVEIEGHCDVRGTEEYNRSLGERRALALREELIRLGIEASRVDTISYGEDRPAVAGNDEAAYRKNRRAEFVLEKHQNLVGLDSPIQNNDPNK